MSDSKHPTAMNVQDDGAQTPDSFIGQILGERYRIEQRLGHGAMGVIYRARHEVLDSLLAVKVLRKPQNQEDQQRFLQEAQLASTVNHPNTVQIIDFGVLPGGQSYLVMELMRGSTVASEVEKGPMESLRVCRIGVQIARGLQAVHDQGIIHRDMKPENVFLLERDGSSDFVKIVDFGIAKSVIDAATPLAQAEQSAEIALAGSRRALVHTKAGNTLGTPPYMAPEQCVSKHLDGRCDQYALGCMLYEMLTGRFLFDEKTAVKYMLAHVKTTPIPPRKRTPELDIPESIEAVVMRMLQKDPHARFATMKDAAEALTQAADVLLIARGEKTVLPAGLSNLFGSWLQDSQLIAQSKRRPSRARRAVIALLGMFALGGVAYLGAWYKTSVQRANEKPTLELWQFQTERATALEALREAVRPGGSTGTNTDRALRLDAISALAESKDAGVRSELEALLADADETVQVAAAAALGRLGDQTALPALQAASERTKSSRLRLTTARAMLDLGEEQSEKVLVDALSSAALTERLQAASLLCDRQNEAAEKLLLLAVDDGQITEPPAILDALECLLKSPNAETARAMLRLRLQSASNDQQRIDIAKILARNGEAEGRRVLRELVDKSGRSQLSAAQALAAPDVPEVAELFREVLRDSHAPTAVRFLACEGIGRSGQLDDILRVGKLLGDAAPELRAAAAAAVVRLAAIDPAALVKESVRWARDSLDDADWQRREAAAVILSERVSPESFRLLTGLLADRDARVRRGAARALGRRTDEPTLLLLKESLRDPDTDVRIEAIRSLGRISVRREKANMTDVRQQLASWFGEILTSGGSREQILSRAVLFALGDSSQAAALATWKSNADPAVRRFLLEQANAAHTFASDLLKDSDPGVRFAAAQALAEEGDTRGLDVLQSTLTQGGPDGVAAYGLLIRLEQPVPETASIQTALATTQPVKERLAAVAAMGRLPGALAMPLLFKAARDPEPRVREASAEVAAELPSAKGALAPGFPVLRLLLSDPDPAVKSRAAALLGRIGTS